MIARIPEADGEHARRKALVQRVLRLPVAPVWFASAGILALSLVVQASVVVGDFLGALRGEPARSAGPGPGETG